MQTVIIKQTKRGGYVCQAIYSQQMRIGKKAFAKTPEQALINYIKRHEPAMYKDIKPPRADYKAAGIALLVAIIIAFIAL